MIGLPFRGVLPVGEHWGWESTKSVELNVSYCFIRNTIKHRFHFDSVGVWGLDIRPGDNSHLRDLRSLEAILGVQGESSMVSRTRAQD